MIHRKRYGKADRPTFHGAVRSYFSRAHVPFGYHSSASMFDNSEIFAWTRNQSGKGRVTASARSGTAIVRRAAAAANCTARKYLAGADGCNPVVTG